MWRRSEEARIEWWRIIIKTSTVGIIKWKAFNFPILFSFFDFFFLLHRKRFDIILRRKAVHDADASEGNRKICFALKENLNARIEDDILKTQQFVFL